MTDVNVNSDSFLTFDDGSGAALYAGGTFAFTGESQYRYTVARWEGRVWTDIGTDLPRGWYNAGPWLRALDDGAGPFLCAFGFYAIQGVPGWNYWVARWNGTTWHPAASGLVSADASPLLSFDDGSGMVIYGFRRISETIAGLAQWNGSSWTIVGTPVGGAIGALAIHDDGSGPALVASGGFTSMSGVPARFIAKWNGQVWAPLGTGLGMGVRAMATYNDGSGPALYVVGSGTEAGGIAVRNVAKWDGQGWSDVGGGLSNCASCPEALYSAHVFDDGRGPALYVGGYISYGGGNPMRGIARWDGHSWTGLGAGLTGIYLDEMAVFDDGRGPSLFVTDTSIVGGGFSYGVSQWVGCPNCYPDCDNDQRLNIHDFLCFINRFAVQDPYANCTVDATIDIADFACFLNKFAQGCP